MKAIFNLLLLVLSIMVSQTSCKKRKAIEEVLPSNPPITLDSMRRCYGQTAWDSTTIHHALIGKWQWKYIKCFWHPEDANSEDFKNLTIEFKQNDSVEVKFNNEITQRSSWNITRLNDGYFRLSVNPIVLQLPGKVLFCNDQVLFYDSYTDGCDNYFKKLD